MRPGTLTSSKHLGTPLSQPASSTQGREPRWLSPGLLGKQWAPKTSPGTHREN